MLHLGQLSMRGTLQNPCILHKPSFMALTKRSLRVRSRTAAGSLWRFKMLVFLLRVLKVVCVVKNFKGKSLLSEIPPEENVSGTPTIGEPRMEKYIISQVKFWCGTSLLCFKKSLYIFIFRVNIALFWQCHQFTYDMCRFQMIQYAYHYIIYKTTQDRNDAARARTQYILCITTIWINLKLYDSL